MNTRQGPHPNYSFVTRFYKGSRRPVVIITAFVTAIWCIFAAVGFFRNIGPYNDNDAPKLATISIVIGCLYTGVFLIGAFGVFAAVSRKRPLIRIFSYLSALAVLIVAGVNLLRIITHFTMKKTILGACANAATGRTYVYGGWWGPLYSGTLNVNEAQRFCDRYYERDSWSLILGFLILTIIGVIFSVIAFDYARESLDPTNPANIIRDSHRTPFTPAPAHYNPPFGGYNVDYNQGYYPPPPGPPPGPYSGPDDGKPPGYTGRDWEDVQDMQKNRDDDVPPKTGDLRH